MGRLHPTVDDRPGLRRQWSRYAPHLVQTVVASSREYHSGYPPPDHGDDRPAGAGPHDERYLSGKGGGDSKASARQALVLPIAHLLRRLERLAPGAGSLSAKAGE